jgi:hypothetical protein
VAVCVALTADTLAVNEAELAPEAIVRLPGTFTELLLLTRFTSAPPSVAAELSETVQFVVAEPVNELPSQESAETVDVPPEDGVALFSVIEVCFVTDSRVAESVTVCAAVTADAFAAKLALAAPEATVTEAGTVNALLLLERLTTTPALGAAEVSVTVQVSCPAPVRDDFAQLMPESDGSDDPFDCDPLPCSFTFAAEAVSGVARVSSPVKSASPFGLK